MLEKKYKIFKQYVGLQTVSFLETIKSIVPNIYMAIIGIATTILLLAGLLILWLFVNNKIKESKTRDYINLLITSNSLIGEDKMKKLQENFISCKHPFYKTMWGMVILSEARKVKDIKLEEKTMHQIIKIKGSPLYVKNAIKTELANKYLFKKTKESSAEARTLVSAINPKDPMYSTAAEIKLNLMLEGGQWENVEAFAHKILSNAPTNLFYRLSEEMYAVSWHIKSNTKIEGLNNE